MPGEVQTVVLTRTQAQSTAMPASESLARVASIKASLVLHLAIRRVPALFMDGNRVLDSLKGTLTVLQDAGFTDEEAIAWLFTEDESLPGRPIDALHGGRKTEIRRRAQALAW